LLSSEHSRAISWGDGASTESEEKGDSNRVYHFEVAKIKDQGDNVVVREGFMVRRQYDNALSPAVTLFPVRHKMTSPLIVNQAPPPGWDTDPRAFCPALLHGEKVQGFMTTTFMPARIGVEPFAHDHQTTEQIRIRW
jgi:hypothetical protein